MKTERKDSAPPSDITPYPKLRISNDRLKIVLFSSPTVGTVVWTAPNYTNFREGEMYDFWKPVDFTDYYGAIELSN